MSMSDPDSGLTFQELAKLSGFDRDLGDALDAALSAVGGGDGSMLAGPLVQRLDFLSGVQNAYNPAGFTPNSVLVQTVSPTALLTIRSFPAAAHGDLLLFVHGGDGGTSTGQKGRIKIEHLYSAYDASQGGDNSVHHSIYLPNQRDWTMWPADAMLLRRDSGHVSWRCILRSSGGQFEIIAPKQISLGGDEGLYTDLAFAAGVTNNLDPGVGPYSRYIIGAHASGSSIGGLRPPENRYYDESADGLRPYGGTMVTIFNAGPGALTLISGHPAGNAAWQFLSSANVVIPANQTRMLHYENYGTGYYKIHGAP